MTLNDKDFVKVIDATPLISIDLIITDRQGRILMGKRKNPPARDTWFVPGGRIKKGETVDYALTRIAADELNIPLTKNQGRFLGVFDHFYETNFANVEGISTQYIVLAYQYDLEPDIKSLPLDQHSQWYWFSQSQSAEVHPNSAAYFRAVH